MESVIERRDAQVLRCILQGDWSSPDLPLGDDQEQGDVLGWAIRVGDDELLEEIISAGAEPFYKVRLPKFWC